MRRLNDNAWIITLFLVNGQQEPSSKKDTAWLFQTQLTVKSPNPNKTDIFVKKAIPRHLANQDYAILAENQTMAMLYRHHVEFAVGHGVSVHATTLPDNCQRATELTTHAIPAYEIPKTTPPTREEIPDLAGLNLDMEELAEANPQDLPNLLNPLIKAYSIRH